jgi:predicted ATP-dependent endonuclease of OLD family
LSVIFDTDNVRFSTHPNGGDIMHRHLKIEVRDARHGDVETNFATRSSGFQWFFSFFAAFSAYQGTAEPLVVLLDEPGTSLHGDAQQDFIRFLAEELAATKQTIYTTHSQHMIDTTEYEKLRAVDDRATREDPDQGVVVSAVGLSVDRDTVLPVESALGASVTQHLFIGPGQHLVVEGGSDFIYLQRLTEHFIAQGDDLGLDPRLTVIPVGGVDNMPAFVALLGQRLTVSALVDGARADRTLRRIENAAQANGIPRDAIVLCADVDEELPQTADIEDLFEVSDYLRLFNWAFDTTLALQSLPDTNEPILRRIGIAFGEFDHGLPAHALSERRLEFFSDVHPKTVERFRKLFSLLNDTVRI